MDFKEEALEALKAVHPSGIGYRDTTLVKMFEESAIQIDDMLFRVTPFLVRFRRTPKGKLRFEGIYIDE